MDSEQLCFTITDELRQNDYQPQFCFICTIKQDAPIHSTFTQLTLKNSQVRYICKAKSIKNGAERYATLGTLNKIKQAALNGVVQILHTFAAEDILCTVMPKGIQNLQTFLKRRERLSDEKLIDFILQITLAVASLHSAGFVHREINPSNFILFEKQKVKLAKLNSAASFWQLLTKEESQIDLSLQEIKQEFAKARQMIQDDIYALGITLITLIISTKKPFLKYSAIPTSQNIQDLLNSTQILKPDKQKKEKILKQALLSLITQNTEERIDAVGMLKVIMKLFFSQKQEHNYSLSLFGSLLQKSEDEVQEKEEKQKALLTLSKVIEESQNRLNHVNYKSLDLEQWYIEAIIKRTIHFKDSDGTLMEYKGAVLLEDLETPNGNGLLTTPNWTFQGLFVKGKKSRGRLEKISKEEYEGPFQNDLPHGEGIQRMPGLFLEYRGSFENGKRHGKGTLRWDQDTIYDGDFQNGHIKGEGRFECHQFIVLNKGYFQETQQGGAILVSGTISAKEKLVPKMLKNFGADYGIKLNGPINFLYQEQNYYSCRYNQGKLVSFFNFNRADRRSFTVLNEQEDEMDPSSLTGKMRMEWDYIQHHPSGLSGTHNCYYEGEVLNGKEHGLGLRTNKIDKVKYKGRFNMGQREDQEATQIEEVPESDAFQVYIGPFVKDQKHGQGEIIRNNISYVVKYERGVQKNIMTKQESLNTFCSIF